MEERSRVRYTLFTRTRSPFKSPPPEGGGETGRRRDRKPNHLGAC